MSTSGVDCNEFDRFAPVVAAKNAHAASLEHAREREDVASVVVDEQGRLPNQILVGASEPLEHLLLLDGKIGDDAVQEERCLVEQSFRQFDALHHDAPRHGVEPRVFLGGEFATREHHNRHVAQRVVA